jgi:hypothetical protein
VRIKRQAAQASRFTGASGLGEFELEISLGKDILPLSKKERYSENTGYQQ